MNAPTLHNVQVISRDGKPEYAVVPYVDYLRLIEKIEGSDALIPHEVVELVIEKEFNLLKAWRKHLGLTQKEVARRAGITQSALSQMERTADNNRTATLEKLAKALGIETGQLVD
ncbi:helix-turn-helix domain-containing protein [uncultured Desulfosarcina sp.]|uniref:helix-turn-helix domain-containing protein n=1 Tax=uncultured Desulfosarcina sp. TaxID=218289 RepID=UPI0029C6DFA4|nr:helix-turn-helix domain-containing protein [uncultured Desulfosarcina sp.]